MMQTRLRDPVSAGASGHRLLRSLEALADRWAVDESDETRVWFDLQRRHAADRREKALR